ncbi:LysR family transcriptional regulator [Nitratireductor sp. ZSWI3]|uniref:LysR family transcriptional regulator n=1 Tax=Nitratireductor sp. ZSWI3 TaxID=2966359 RepID=UPI002150219F|nr:LysR family transcriptional regulator [Nitratireductor sp. ZSWI3]MCR4267266.1 LysR family transcriptional regulator [Nitratireductor sp. ZSWI3]
MRAFVAVGQKLSFADAANELGISPSALSRRVAQLEDSLGCRLLQRTTRRVTLTEVGALYLDRCVDILARSEEADAAVSKLAREPQGLLRVTLPNLYGQLRVAPLLPEFMRRYPKLKLELSFDDRFVDLVARRADVGIRIGNLETGDYVARKLAPNKRFLCASPDHLNRFGHPTQIADLSRHACLHFSPLMEEGRWRLSHRGRKVEVPIDPVVRADNAEALRQLALGGQGIALLAGFLIDDDIRTGRLVQILPEWTIAESWVFAVYPHARFLPMKTRVFVDFLAETIG